MHEGGNVAEFFHDQLETSRSQLVWALEQIPVHRREISPPADLGEWTAGRHLFHIVHYERDFALPAMRLWLTEIDAWTPSMDEAKAWGNGQALGLLIEQFHSGREAQIDLLSRFGQTAWDERHITIGRWGSVTLRWLVSKTLQHTASHISALLEIALFWDALEAGTLRADV